MTWFVLSLLAGALQTVRNGSSKALTKSLSPIAITWTRFALGLPVILTILFALFIFDYQFGKISTTTYWYIFISGILQLTANALLVYTFSLKTFFVAILLYKTENIFALLIESALYGEEFSLLSFIGISLGIVGAILTVPRVEGTSILKSFFNNKGQILGLLSAIIIASASIASRYGILTIEGGQKVSNSTLYLALLIIFEIIILTSYLLLKERTQFKLIIENKKVATTTGITSAIGSFCWLWAFSLTSVAMVKTVGQIEMLLTGITSAKYFSETVTRLEILGAILISLSIVVIAVS